MMSLPGGGVDSDLCRAFDCEQPLDVVLLVGGRLDALDFFDLTVLRMAACLGSTFRFSTLDSLLEVKEPIPC
jgi:hypothetical protein